MNLDIVDNNENFNNENLAVLLDNLEEVNIKINKIKEMLKKQQNTKKELKITNSDETKTNKKEEVILTPEIKNNIIENIEKKSKITKKH